MQSMGRRLDLTGDLAHEGGVLCKFSGRRAGICRMVGGNLSHGWGNLHKKSLCQ